MIFPSLIFLITSVVTPITTPNQRSSPSSLVVQTPWAERVFVKDVYSRLESGLIGFRLFQVTKTKDGSTWVEFSLPAAEQMASTSATSYTVEQRRVLEDTEALYTNDLTKLWMLDIGEITSSQRCSKKRVVNTLRKIVALSVLTGPKVSPNILARVNMVTDIYRTVLNQPDVCPELLGGWLFIVADDPIPFLEPGDYSSFTALSLLQQNATIECEFPRFTISSIEFDDFVCAKKLAGIPKEPLTHESILRPVYAFAIMLVKTQPSILQKPFFSKLIESGIYLSDIPLKYVSTAVHYTGQKVLRVNGQKIGAFSASEINPLLYDMLQAETCRELLTVKGVQRYCLDSN